MRALALASAGRLDEAIAAGAEAVNAESPGVGRELAQLEHARMLLRAKRNDEALGALRDPPSDLDTIPLVGVFRAQTRATVAVRQEQREQAKGLLAKAWGGLAEPLPASSEVFFEVTMTDAWVWDIYRPARFAMNVRVITFKDVNVEELAKADLEVPKGHF